MFIFKYFIKVGKFSDIISSNILCPFLSSFGTPTMSKMVHLLVSHRCSIHFSSIFFFYCSSDLLISIVLSLSLLNLCSACSNLPLNTSNNFFLISVIVLYSSRISFFGFFIGFSISSLIFLFCSYIIFLTFFNLSFSSLSILKTVILKSLSSRSAIRSFLGHFCWFTYSFEWVIFSSFFVCFGIVFLLKIVHLNLVLS